MDRKTPSFPWIFSADPLADYEANKTEIRAALEDACNHVGEGVIVGRGVVLWGGKGANVVGIRLGDGVRLYDQCRLVLDQISPESGIALGEKVALNFGVYIDGAGGVTIGAGAIVGPNVMIVSSSHRIEPDCEVQSSGKSFAPATIGRGVWIGGNASILAGVTIGDGAVIGAGSTVTRDVAPKTVVAGNPARAVRTIE